MNRIVWNPAPTERVLIEHLPEEFVREIEFISWAELRGLTPETLVEMRGKVAA